jgi:hypothetical protein
MQYGKWFIWFMTGCWIIMLTDWLIRKREKDEH